MNNRSQPPQPAEPDMALLFLGSFFENLHHAPVRDDAKLDALAMQILDKGPKTLPGLVIRARAEKWLRRHLWTLAFDSLSPLEQGLRVVIDSAMRIDCDPARKPLQKLTDEIAECYGHARNPATTVLSLGRITPSAGGIR